MWRLFLLFTLVPAAELYLLLEIGRVVGPAQTVLLIFLTGAVGAWLAKREGIGVMRDLQESLAQGLPQSTQLAEGVMVFAGGLLLLTPGILTDITGFLLIAPPSRRFLAPRILDYLAKRITITGVNVGPGRPINRDNQSSKPFANPFDDLP